jgi:aspartyl-tRNA(Asn)/glutamyl-tRNA(Gln) amidotransferase subunit C
MTLTLEEVRHIAELARLRLTPDEEHRFAGQLSAILEYASRLKQVDTAAIPPTTSVLPMDAPLRGDLPRPSQSRERWLANAASIEEGMFRVPPVFEEES